MEGRAAQDARARRLPRRVHPPRRAAYALATRPCRAAVRRPARFPRQRINTLRTYDARSSPAETPAMPRRMSRAHRRVHDVALARVDRRSVASSACRTSSPWRFSAPSCRSCPSSSRRWLRSRTSARSARRPTNLSPPACTHRPRSGNSFASSTPPTSWSTSRRRRSGRRVGHSTTSRRRRRSPTCSCTCAREPRNADRVAALAHELRHALEIAGAPMPIRRASDLRQLYTSVGFACGPRSYDSTAAAVTEAAVRRELDAGSTRRPR